MFTAAFCGLVLLSTGTLLFITLKNAFQTTRNSLGMRIESVIDEAVAEVDSYFDAIEDHTHWLVRQFGTGAISPTDQRQLKEIFTGALSNLPQIAEVALQFTDGAGIVYTASSSELSNVEWDPVFRVSTPSSQGQRIRYETGYWSIRPSALTHVREGTFMKPFQTPNGISGVVLVAANLSPLSEIFASDAFLGQHQLVRFLLLNKRVVLAHPELKEQNTIDTPVVSRLQDPFLKELETTERSRIGLIAEIPGVDVFTTGDSRSRPRVFAIHDITRPRSGGDLTVGVHFDPKAGEAEIDRLLSIALTGFILLVGSFIAAIVLGRRGAAPFHNLANVAQLVERDKLDEIKPLKTGWIKELASAASAFNNMVEGLKERTRVRDLFGKYVPQNVAALLLKDDGISQPINTEATIMFLDIVEFSAISEKLTPAEVVETMNAFFSDAVALIEEEQGMVTQFQGDAILAVFNVPVKVEDHAEAAIRTSIAIQKRIRERDFEGHELRCRIGINTGALVAGAIGAADRLSYTVYGDAVNVAVRLEQMNKTYGTEILLSASTVRLAPGYDFKLIGEVPVKGREVPVEIHTLADNQSGT